MIHVALFLLLLTRTHRPDRCNSDFFRASWDLLQRARYGRTEFEQAAFAVQDDDGHVRFVRWPACSSCPRRSVYAGTIPAGAFAVVHTHPNVCPLPSDGDAQLAKRLRMPVYVLTRTRISATAGHKAITIELGDWNPDRCRTR